MIEVTIDPVKDTRDNLLSRFEKNSSALYKICVAILKDLSENSGEDAIIQIMETKYNSIIKNTTEQDRLENFSVQTKKYIGKILDKDEEFFNKLGSVILDQHADNIQKQLGNMGSNVINVLKNMINRISRVDQKVKDKIWTILINMLKLSMKYDKVVNQ
jgi:hypothetical protein